MMPSIPWPAGPATAVLEAPARTQVTAQGRPAVLAVSGRSLVLVAGLPSAGKTTLLKTLDQDRAVRVSDSDPLRAAVVRLMPRGTRYGLVRPAVHLLHRAGVAGLALGPSLVVVVHLPATSARLLAGELDEGWATTLRLDRQVARRGLRIETRQIRADRLRK